MIAGVGRTPQEGCRRNRRGRQPKREIVPEGIEKRARSSFGCHSERKCPELQGYKRRASTAENRDCSLRLRSPVPAPHVQAAFAVLRLTCGNDHFSMVSLRRVWKNADDEGIALTPGPSPNFGRGERLRSDAVVSSCLRCSSGTVCPRHGATASGVSYSTPSR